MSTETSKLHMALQLTGVEAKWLQPFEVTDPFNDGLRLSGYLCQKPDHRYGALALLEVDGTSVPQLILATPKLHYPIDRAGTRQTEDDKLTGTEGLVWYVEQPDGMITLFKCKPESVEDLHWATGINKPAVLMTCWNLLETQDDLAYDTLLPLLLEEYSAEEIEHFRAHIEDCLAEVHETLAFREHVLGEYGALGRSILTHKAEVMRALSARFARAEMKKVYSIIMRYSG